MKKIITGILACALLLIAVPTFGSSIYENIKATIRPDYSIEVDGKRVELSNQPVVINGSTYLPVREVAAILDTEVGFKDGVIKINTNDKIEDSLDEEVYRLAKIQYDNIKRMIDQEKAIIARYEESLAKAKADENSTLNDIQIIETSLLGANLNLEKYIKEKNKLLEEHPQLANETK